jgi:hypothetical protein
MIVAHHEDDIGPFPAGTVLPAQVQCDQQAASCRKERSNGNLHLRGPFIRNLKLPVLPLASEIPHAHLHTLTSPLLLAGKAVQPVSESDHEVAREPVGARVRDAVAGDGTVDIGGLLKDIVSGETEESVLLFEKGFFK